MDIRKFLKRKNDSDETDSSNKVEKKEKVSSDVEKEQVSCVLNKNDIGNFVSNKETLTDERRRELLDNPFVPGDDYDFKADAFDKTRCFKLSYLEKYSPWMVYSALLKGAICLFCVLFPQPVRRGVQGSFIVKAFTKYKHIGVDAENHVKSEWHKGSVLAASNFKAVTRDVTRNIVCQIDCRKINC